MNLNPSSPLPAIFPANVQTCYMVSICFLGSWWVVACPPCLAGERPAVPWQVVPPTQVSSSVRPSGLFCTCPLRCLGMGLNLIPDNPDTITELLMDFSSSSPSSFSLLLLKEKTVHGQCSCSLTADQPSGWHQSTNTFRRGEHWPGQVFCDTRWETTSRCCRLCPHLKWEGRVLSPSF